ncbi:MAG: HAMP domain-containing histidine kinase [Fibrobacteria bacterium]|nr:HAMP domain-containing histidine kinase [Fibrobacteria bacterium]
MEIGSIIIKSEQEIAAVHQAAMNCFNWLEFDQTSKANCAEVLNELSQIGYKLYGQGTLEFKLSHKNGRTGLFITAVYKNKVDHPNITPGKHIPAMHTEQWLAYMKDLMDDVQIHTQEDKSTKIIVVKWLAEPVSISKDLWVKIKKDFSLFSSLSPKEIMGRLNVEVVDAWKEIKYKNNQLEQLLKKNQTLEESGGDDRQLLKDEVDLRVFSETALAGRSKALNAIYRLAIAKDRDLQTICDGMVREFADLFSVSFASLSIEVGLEQNVYSQFTDGLCTHTHLLTLQTLPKGMKIENGKCYQFTGDINKELSIPISIKELPYQSLLCYKITDTNGENMGTIFILDKNKRVFEEFHLFILETFAYYLSAEIYHFRTEKQLVRSKEMELLGIITSGVAHEVRNPLNAILAVSQAMFRKLGSNEEIKPFIEHINTQIKRLSSIMSDLLELGKPLRNENMGEQTLDELVSGGVRAWRESSVYTGRKIEIHMGSIAQQRTVHSDKMKMQQVIVNLLENACSHCSEEKSIIIDVTTSNDGKSNIKFTDHGTGMDKEMLPRFFDPFFSTRKGGIGLGTSIVKRIIQSHGGSIIVYNNEPPPGLTVEFTLPQK